MRFSPYLLDEIRARLPVSQVVGRKVALKKKGREFAGLSPFKTEKTPSFFVNDQKGFYHCFASSEHGDIFTFLMKTEGLSFPEAVERLASEAGVTLPKPTERDQSREDERQRLLELLNASADFYRRSLSGSQATEARRYLEARGLARETMATFALGFAPSGRQALAAHLKQAGFTSEEMVRAGMQIAGDDIPEPYDRFRNRIMFPIHDLSGRTIAFGGRALDSNAPAKYLNSPETPLFHKGHILFNANRARSAAHDRNRLIVVEGYMDVVALAEHGFPETVAPLGTALTEDQIRLLWRMTDCPVLCFDGDEAGKRAAHRAVDTALPHVKPGKSLAFVFLPDGLDPDDLVRQHGVQAMEDNLGRGRPLIDVLWERELAAGPTQTPEQKAALETRLRALTSQIADTVVRAHYEREVRDRLFQLSRPQRNRTAAAPRPSGQKGAGWSQSSYAAPLLPPDWRSQARYRLGGTSPRYGRQPYARGGWPDRQATRPSAALSSRPSVIHPREALILRTIINHPWLIDDHAETIADLQFQSPALNALRDEILTAHASTNSLDSTTLANKLTKSGVAKVVDLVAQSMTHNSDRFADPEASATDVEAAWHHILALHQRQDALRQSLRAAEEAWHRDCTPEAEARLLDIQQQISALSAFDMIDLGSGTSDEVKQ